MAAHHGIVFIGFMAAGKTRAAQAVAERVPKLHPLTH